MGRSRATQHRSQARATIGLPEMTPPCITGSSGDVVTGNPQGYCARWPGGVTVDPMTNDTAPDRPTYESPTLEVMGTLHEITMGGSVPVNELPNQPDNNNDAFPVAS